jgi:hypothetical protein
LRDNFYFGGGAHESSMHPAVLLATLLAVLSILVLRRKYAFAPVLVVAFLTPFGEQLLIGGFHFFALRIIILVGLAKLMWLKCSSKAPLGRGLHQIEKIFFAWAILHAATFILLFRDTGAVTYEMAFLLDACGGYVLFRYFIQDKSDVLRMIKTLSLIAAILAVCMGFEYMTRVNVFSYINTRTIVPWVRDGRVRAQGIFANSITAGTFGASLFPLFFLLWKSGTRILGALGLVASSVIAVTAMASTGVMAYLAGVAALLLWPLRKHMRQMRWGIVLTVLVLALAMRAPVWFIIARFDFVGGHGWDRAALIDATVHHFSDWWFLGTKTNASWGADTWDACNEFVYQATSGGLLTFLLFIAILSRAFGMIGKARKQVEGHLRQEWFFWCLGAALYAHVMGFWGIDYFDVIRTWWYMFLAMIPAATLSAEAILSQPRHPALIYEIGIPSPQQVEVRVGSPTAIPVARHWCD